MRGADSPKGSLVGTEELLLVAVVAGVDDAEADDEVDASLEPPFFTYFLSLLKLRLAIAWLRLLQRVVRGVARRVKTAKPAARIIPSLNNYSRQKIQANYEYLVMILLCASNANSTFFEQLQ